MTQPIANVVAYTAQHGGGTFEAGTYLPFAPEYGFAVALGGVKMAAQDATIEALARWLPRVANEWNTSFVGTWLRDNILHVDAVVYIRDLTFALQVAREHRQLAIYDFATKASITLAVADVEGTAS